MSNAARPATRATAALSAAGVSFSTLFYEPEAGRHVVEASGVDVVARSKATASVDEIVGAAEPTGVSSGRTLGEYAARSLGLAAATVFKTLMVNVDGHLVVAVVPVDHRLDLKALAAAAAAKRAVLADPSEAERSSGYVVGGISPLGQRKKLRTYLDDTMRAFDSVTVNGGRRGLMIQLAPDDLQSLTAGTWAHLSRL